ncbi:hypothetical protein OIU84_021131 [Salix udensis]|uniref:Uncharacterized protein n=1 Tax=Salix udensis TaxID=889485 RepID=A0AAD6KTY5_9ROSI|nr:hypothetical protein OIU84_021131 [Salix udensis]
MFCFYFDKVNWLLFVLYIVFFNHFVVVMFDNNIKKIPTILIFSLHLKKK